VEIFKNRRENLKRLMAYKNLLPKDLVASTGWKQPYVSDILNGVKNIGNKSAKKIVDVFGVSERELDAVTDRETLKNVNPIESQGEKKYGAPDKTVGELTKKISELEGMNKFLQEQFKILMETHKMTVEQNSVQKTKIEQLEQELVAVKK